MTSRLSCSQIALLILGVVLLCWLGWQQRPVHYGPDFIKLPAGSIDVQEDPLQEDAEGEAWRVGKFKLTPLATFTVRARILSLRRYRSDYEAKLSPMDLALGWGPMARSRVLRDMTISQEQRWYYWRSPDPPLPTAEITAHSANMHVIPASKRIANGLRALRRGQHVEIVGELVEIREADGWSWRSSTTRRDAGAGACEVVYVRKLSYCAP